VRGRLLLRASLGLILLGGASLALVPEWPGFWVLLTSLGLLLLLFYGPSKIRADLASLIRPPRRAGFLRLAFCLLAVILLALAGLAGRRLPILNLAGPLQAGFNPQTFELLKKLDNPVSLEAFVSDARRETRVRWLLDQYARASTLIAVSVSRAEAKADLGGEEIALSRPESVVVESGPFREVVSPISQAAIDASIRRLLSPNRLVLNLMGDGEKSVFDASPMGLSLWASSLEKSKIHLKDCLWAQPALPPEAWAAHALVLAGPRRPLGEAREAALMDYLSKGGKLLIFQDPMVVGFRSAALRELGLSLPWGLVVDPYAAWAGTEDFFVISRDFPAHPLTMGLTQPVVWPLAGAVAAAQETASQKTSAQSESIVLSNKDLETEGLSSQELKLRDL
jgi:hypothetical protein